MTGKFAERSITISAIYHCSYHPQGGVGYYQKESNDRKPNPGMILRAREDLGLDLGKSILLGDKETDIEAAINAGVGFSVLVGVPEEGVATKANLVLTDLSSFTDWFQSYSNAQAYGR